MPIPSSAELKALYAIRDNLKSGLASLCCKIDALGGGTTGGGVDHELAIACNPLTGESVIVSYGYDASGTLTITNTNLDGTPYTGPAPENCATSGSFSVSQRLVTPTGSNNAPIGIQVRETKIYDASGALISTVYTDPVTNVVVTLPVGTTAFAESVPVQKEPMFMCDNGVTFIRHFAYDYGIGILTNIDTNLAGAPYTPTGPVSAGVCTSATITNTPGLQLTQSSPDGTVTSPFAADYVRISYDPPIGTPNPITVQLPDITLGNGTFEVFPNNQESFSFATGVINSVIISNSVGPHVTVEFRHK